MLEVGQTVPVVQVTSVTGETIKLQEPEQLIHIQFRRFAGCPVCDVHLREFVTRSKELETNGIREVVFFHSTTEELQHYESQLGELAVIPDPEKAIYAKFGVESSIFGLLSPWALLRSPFVFYRTTLDFIAGNRRLPNAINPTGGITGLPAEFLVGANGKIIACKYGGHPNDQWSFDELLEEKSRVKA